MKLLVIIPAYNEEKNILQTIKQLSYVTIKDYTLDYIVINDGSNDTTRNICINNNINFINLPFNLGIGEQYKLAISMLFITIMMLLFSLMEMGNMIPYI